MNKHEKLDIQISKWKLAAGMFGITLLKRVMDRQGSLEIKFWHHLQVNIGYGLKNELMRDGFKE